VHEGQNHSGDQESYTQQLQGILRGGASFDMAD
jgi:hypothetical protein